MATNMAQQKALTEFIGANTDSKKPLKKIPGKPTLSGCSSDMSTGSGSAAENGYTIV